ncbi:MAG: hypothetical protein KKB13_03795 [Chloroflexi bacterium]|nr:hypothetical protein [Chloroflexota bacterium]
MRQRLEPRSRIPRLGCEQFLLYALLAVLIVALGWGFAQTWADLSRTILGGIEQLAGQIVWPGDQPTPTLSGSDVARTVVWTPEVFPTYTPTPTTEPTATPTETPTPIAPVATRPGPTAVITPTLTPVPTGYDYVVESQTQQQVPGQSGVCAGQVTGRVLDANGQPVTGIQVEARWGSGPEDRAIVPRPGVDPPFNGTFEFCLSPGGFDIRILDGDRPSQSAHVDVPRLEGQVVVCEVNFRRAY